MAMIPHLAAALVVAMASVFAGPVAMAAASTPPPEAAMCVACHGAHGEGSATGVPRLAGQNAEYLSHALSMFRDGTRTSAIMQPIARTLNDAQMRELADHFSKQAAPLAHAAPAAQPLVAAGKELSEKGAPPTVAACFSCHGSQGEGNGARFPRIASQPEQFVIDRLHEFQARARAKTPDPGTMTAVSATLNEQQIRETAADLAQLER
jgi:cytochrome c553